uniref:Neurotransmitter-gated ion-channel ligand-binding domain-containing protein n=1 Tax=Gasterosteus aculeatus aculeatus TaxID=481459 RepID=A0AAQ4R5V9_GASAC
MLRFLNHSFKKAVVLLTLLTGYGHAQCTTRRCLAEMLIKKEYLSQPQTENCTQNIFVKFLEYQTLSVDTKSLLLISRLRATLEWTDPDLAWNTSVYQFNEVILPVSKIWSPELHVTNGITTEMSHSSPDLLANSKGTVIHSVIINAQVICEVNLFNYPFASDKCPVAIQGWSRMGCGTNLVFGELKTVIASSGEWETGNATLERKRSDRNFILVPLSIKSTQPFITLVLPSILIVLADAVSFALPLGGGERNGFKVTLVLSFTMSLIILNDELPGDGECSPIIRQSPLHAFTANNSPRNTPNGVTHRLFVCPAGFHFCCCLVILVVSMLWSMVMTRLSAEGRFGLFRRSKGPVSGNAGGGNAKEDEEVKAEVGVDVLGGVKEDGQILKKVVNFLEAIDGKTRESDRNQRFASKLDHIFFWFYLNSGIATLPTSNSVMVALTFSVLHRMF